MVDAGKITQADFETFKTIFQENFKNYFNTIGNKYLEKPITRIRYTFIILEEHNYVSGSIKLVPAIFNIRQLELKHLPILERLNDIIKLELPYKFGIINKTDYDAGLKYELFNSYYKYVNFFHITTEYIHMMSNFTDYAHNLKDCITLEEIIYSVSREKELGFPLFSQLRIDYKIRDYRVINNSDNLSHKQKPTSLDRNGNTQVGGSRSKISRKNNQMNMGTFTEERELLNNIVILLMYEDIYSVYTFIYKNKSDGKFRKMKIKANLINIKNNIEKYIALSKITTKGSKRIKNVYSCKNEYIKLLQFQLTDNIKNFIILEDVEFKEDDIRFIFMQGFITSKKLEGITKTEPLSIKYFYNTELLKDKSPDLQIYNIYNEEPILIQNYKQTVAYIKQNTQIPQNCNRNKYNNNREHFKNCSDILGITDCVINCIHFNVNNCGYDFIEIIDKKDGLVSEEDNNYVSRGKRIKSEITKKTVYVIPTRGRDTSYLGNFLELGKEHLSMLEEFKKIYKKDNSVCFLHRGSIFPIFYCLHFHIIQYDLYNRKYPGTNIGTFINQEMHIQTIINILSTDTNYFKKYNINFLLNI